MFSSSFSRAVHLPFLLAGRPAVAAQETPRPPNIVFFLVDDMGWRDTPVEFHDMSAKEPARLPKLAQPRRSRLLGLNSTWPLDAGTGLPKAIRLPGEEAGSGTR